MAFESKFIRLCETIVTRFESGGFLVGDYITIKPSIMKSDYVKDRGQNFIDLLDSMIKDKRNLKITAIKSTRPTNSTNIGSGDAPDCLYVDVVIEIAPGGNWKDPITLPMAFIELVQDGTKYPPVPDQLVRKNPSEKEGKGEEAKQTQNMVTPHGLDTKNVKLPFTGIKDSVDLADIYSDKVMITEQKPVEPKVESTEPKKEPTNILEKYNITIGKTVEKSDKPTSTSENKFEPKNIAEKCQLPTTK